MSTLSAVWRSTHPGPTLVVTALAGALGLSARVPPDRLALLVLAVFCGQLSVGLSNDAIDAVRDRAVGRRDKPVARGEIPVRGVWVAAAVTLLAALGLSAALGRGVLATHSLALSSAWAYNLGLKSTAISVIPFLVSFALFPSFATLSATEPRLAPLWAWVAGGALGVAVHFTNVLPDLHDDARTGVRGLPHRLGARTSASIAFGAVVAGAAAVLGGSLTADSSARVLAWACFAMVTIVAGAGLVRALRHPDRMAFQLVMLAALLLVVQLASSGTMAR